MRMASTVDAKLLRQTKFPPEFNQKVDMKKVNIEVLKKWIASKISNILGNEDDVVIELCFNLLEGSRFPDIKALQISLTGFLDKDTPKFCKELWNLCLSAQSNAQGVPKELLEAKKLELLQEKAEAEKAAEDTRRRKDEESSKDREVDIIRQRERAERGRGRGGGGGGGGGGRRGGRPHDSRPSRDSRSPPPYGHGPSERGPPPRREADIYIPRGIENRRRSPIRDRRDRYHARSSSRSVSGSSSPSSTDESRRRPRQRPNSRYAPRQRGPLRHSDLSASPARNRGRNWRGRPESRGDRSRSNSYSERSRSQSPRRRQRAPLSRSSSSSPAPHPRYRQGRRRSPSNSRSTSSTRDVRERRSGRRATSKGPRRPRKSPSSDSHNDKQVSRADVVKARNNRDVRRLSRSGDRSRHRRRHRHRRNRSRSPSHSRSQSRSRSRSRSPGRGEGSRGGTRGDRKRRRSLERWAPAATKKQRNTSSVTSPGEKRQKTTDATAAGGGHALGRQEGELAVISAGDDTADAEMDDKENKGKVVKHAVGDQVIKSEVDQEMCGS